MKTIVLDIESSGLPPKGADYKIDFLKYPRILSIAWKVNNTPTMEYIIAQNGLPIPPEATAINGITDQMALDSPYQLEGILIELLDNGTSDFIIGHNIYFDTSIIKANVLRLIHEGRINQILYNNMEYLLHKDKRIDTMRLCHKLFGGKWPTLEEAYFKLIGVPMNNSHNAMADVNACYAIYEELVKRGIVGQSMMRNPPEPVTLMQEE